MPYSRLALYWCGVSGFGGHCWVGLLAVALVGCAGGEDPAGSDGASFGAAGPGGSSPTDGDSFTSTSGVGTDSATSQGPGSDSDPSDSGSDTSPDCVDGDGDSFGEGCPAGPDCDDTNPDINPGADEVCDGVDDNCDGEVDNGCECDPDGVSGDCNFPTDLGELNVGDQSLGVVANLPQANAFDWYQVAFPTEARPGEGMPRVTFSVNEGEAFVFDIVSQQCGSEGQPCTSGGMDGLAVGLTDWTFVDDDPGCCAPPMDSLVPWPNPVYIRVYRTDGGASCATYQLQLSR